MAELAVKTFVGKDDLVNVTGIVLAGLADLKHELNSPKILDKRVREKILRVVDVQYGMRKGLDEAILQVADLMHEVKLVKDQKLLQRFMMELADDDGLCSCGVGQTMFALEDRRAVTTLICWENLAVRRYTLRDDLSGDTRVVHWTPPRKKGAASDLYTEPGIEELLKSARLDASDSGTDVAHYRVVDQMSLIEWLADHYREHEAKLVFVSDASEAGHQFVESFGGLAGLLRFEVDFEEALGAADGTDDDDPDDGFDDFDDFIVDEPPAAADDATAVEAPEEVKPGAVPVVLKGVGKESDEPKGAQPAPTLEVPPVLKVETPKVHPPTESFSPKPPTPASGNVGSKRAVAPPGFETVLPTPPHARGDDGTEVRAHSPPKEMSKLRYTGSVFVPRAKRGAPAVPDATTAAHLAN